MTIQEILFVVANTKLADNSGLLANVSELEARASAKMAEAKVLLVSDMKGAFVLRVEANGLSAQATTLRKQAASMTAKPIFDMAQMVKSHLDEASAAAVAVDGESQEALTVRK